MQTMRQGNVAKISKGRTVQAVTAMASALALAGSPALARQVAPAPEIILPPAVAPVAAPTPSPQPSAPTVAVPAPELEVPLVETVMPWSLANARALVAAIEAVEAEGLIPADYRLEELRGAIAAGEGTALDEVASHAFAWLAEDLRDGRTPMEARVQWFVVDPDRDQTPTDALMQEALSGGDVAGVLARLAPTHQDYAALKAELALTPAAQKAKRALIRTNMDRWRWLPRDLGQLYLLTNVPEFQLRLVSKNRIIRTYRTIVGKPGRTATPQLAETVEAVVFNPTWTVPQSIVVGEGLGARLIGNPAQARREGYAVRRLEDGTIIVVQQPGPNNALGAMKIDMPNEHAIYLHDTPNKTLFNAQVRAFSHGCIRTERAVELGMTMAILGAQMTPEQGIQNARSGKYTKVTMTQTFPVYLTYFTMARDIAGNLTRFADLYKRDAPVLASFEQPRQLKTGQRKSDEPIIKLDNPL